MGLQRALAPPLGGVTNGLVRCQSPLVEHAPDVFGFHQPKDLTLGDGVCTHHSETQEDFDAAAKEALELPASTTNDDKLAIYGLFKQGTVGDCNTSKPGMFDMKGKAKWDAWDKLKGMSKEDAMQAYIDKVKSLKA